MADHKKPETGRSEGEQLETSGYPLPAPVELGHSMADIAERSQRIVGEWLKRHAETGPSTPDPLNIGGAFMEMTARLMANP